MAFQVQDSPPTVNALVMADMENPLVLILYSCWQLTPVIVAGLPLKETLTCFVQLKETPNLEVQEVMSVR